MLPIPLSSANFLMFSVNIFSNLPFRSGPGVLNLPLSSSSPLPPSKWGCFFPCNLVELPVMVTPFLLSTGGSLSSFIYGVGCVLPFSLTTLLKDQTSDLDSLDSSLSVVNSILKQWWVISLIWISAFRVPFISPLEEISHFSFWDWPTKFAALAPLAIQPCCKYVATFSSCCKQDCLLCFQDFSRRAHYFVPSLADCLFTDWHTFLRFLY